MNASDDENSDFVSAASASESVASRPEPSRTLLDAEAARQLLHRRESLREILSELEDSSSSSSSSHSGHSSNRSSRGFVEPDAEELSELEWHSFRTVLGESDADAITAGNGTDTNADTNGETGRRRGERAESVVARVGRALAKLGALLLALYAFFVALELLSRAFQCTGQAATQAIAGAVSSPLVGLVAGVLITVLLQSSSTTSAIVVSLVAAGVIGTAAAVYIIIGANLGTAATSSFVSLAHIGRRKEFVRAFAGASVHDSFNMLSCIVLVPIEVLVGLSNERGLGLIGLIAHAIVTGEGAADADNASDADDGVSFESPVKAVVKPLLVNSFSLFFAFYYYMGFAF